MFRISRNLEGMRGRKICSDVTRLEAFLSRLRVDHRASHHRLRFPGREVKPQVVRSVFFLFFMDGSLEFHMCDDLCGNQPVSYGSASMGRLNFDFHTDVDAARPPVLESLRVEARMRAR